MKIVLINKRFSPLISATGLHGHRLAVYLSQQGHDVYLIHADTNRNDGSYNKDNLERRVIRSFYNGKHLSLRLISDLFDSLRLVLKAKSIRADRYIILSDPPFVQLLSTFLLSSERVIFWFMDVYPQAFFARGLLRRSNPLYKIHVNRLKSFNPRQTISLGDHQSQFLQDHFEFKNSISIPVGLQEIDSTKPRAIPYWYIGDHLFYFVYKGNLGAAHDTLFLTQMAHSINPKKHRIILSVTGIKSKELYQRVSDLSGVFIVDELAEEDLKFVDIHIVSLIPKWTHICVPSKALLAAVMSSAVLFHGSTESDTWTYVSDIGWYISEDYAHNNEINQFLETLTRKKLDDKKARSHLVHKALSQKLKIAYDEIESQMR